MEKYRPAQTVQQLDKPKLIIQQFLGDPHIRERLVYTPDGDFSVRHKAEKTMRSLKSDSSKTAEILINVIKNKEKNRVVTKGALILLRKIPHASLSKAIQVKRREALVSHLFQLGLSTPDIAKSLSSPDITITDETVRADLTHMRKRGESIKKRIAINNPSKVRERREQANELFARGFTKKQIAEKLGSSKDIIKRDLYVLKKKGQLLPKEK